MGTDNKSRYYQDISAAFLRRRGAPFMLSARELHLLAGWEKQGIPLSAVREGIDRAFRALQKKAGPGRPISLLACDSHVQRAFSQVRERRAGARRPAGGREKKKGIMLRVVRDFLAALPEELSFLRPAYEQALRLIEAGGDSEDDLERLEAEIDEALAAHCPAKELAGAQRELGLAGVGQNEKRNALLCRLAVKELRDKHKIPHVSYPYY
jgi:hypothetical protein